MIVAKLNMKKLPETCKKCPNKIVLDDGCKAKCSITGYYCPTEKKPSGNVGYAMPSWCPLMDIYFPEDE